MRVSEAIAAPVSEGRDPPSFIWCECVRKAFDTASGAVSCRMVEMVDVTDFLDGLASRTPTLNPVR